MCYDVQARLITQLNRARRNNVAEDIERIMKELERFVGKPMFHLSGFSHPEMLIYTQEHPYDPIPAIWGLIPDWVKDEEQKRALWNSTLNARGETIFEKPSFRTSALSKRCVIEIDGFFEHHYERGGKYPYFVQRKDGKPMTVGALWSEWVDKATNESVKSFSIVTTKGNALMTKIHNNPQLNEARMPLLLSEEQAEAWLNEAVQENQEDKLSKVIVPNNEVELIAHRVRPLRGKEYVGNNEHVTDPLELFDLFS